MNQKTLVIFFAAVMSIISMAAALTCGLLADTHPYLGPWSWPLALMAVLSLIVCVYCSLFTARIVRE